MDIFFCPFHIWILEMGGYQVICGDALASNGDAANLNRWIRFGLQDDELSAHLLQEATVVFHQPMTGGEVAACGYRTGAKDLCVGGLPIDLPDGNECPAGKHPLPFPGETRCCLLALTLARKENQIGKPAEDKVRYGFQAGTPCKKCAKADQEVE